jgi:Na+-translocating ferredoxin:NAD+ oxidoreductase subunit B
MDIYESLREVLDAHPSTAPPAESILEILKILYTPEEAGVAVIMSFKVKPLSEIAEKAGLDEETALKHLEAMADKGIIMSRYKNGEKYYGLLPLIPGVFEFPFMKSSLARCISDWETVGRLSS